MKTRGKKALSLLLALMMVVSLFGGITLVSADGETSKAYFVPVDAMSAGDEIMIVAKSGEDYYALTSDGNSGMATPITVDGSIAAATLENVDTAIWTYDGTSLISVAGAKGQYPYFYPYANGLVYNTGRTVTLSDGEFSYGVSGGAKGYLSFNDGAFGYTKNAAEAGEILIFSRVNVGVKADALISGEQYYIVAKSGDDYYTLGANGEMGFAEKATVSESEGLVYQTSGDVALWSYNGSTLTSVAGAKGQYPYFYPYANGLVYNTGRTVTLSDGEFSYGVSGGAKGYLSFNDGAFGYTKNAAEAGEILIYQFISPLKKYSITFDANAEGVDGLTGTKIEGKPYVITEELERKGWIFKGWNTIANDSGAPYAVGDSITAEGDLTLYAIWEEAETVKYAFGLADSVTIGAPVMFVVSAGDKSYALGTDGMGVTTVEVNVETSIPEGSDSEVTTLTAYGEKEIWLMDQNGILANEYFNDAFLSFSSGLTVAAQGGITHFDRNSKKVTFHLTDLETIDYYLTFNGTSFGISANAADACTVTPFTQSGVFVKAEEMVAGNDYVVATKVGDYWAALSYDGSLGITYIYYDEEGGVVYLSGDEAAWSYSKDNVLESVYEPNNAIFAGSGGFMIYDSTGSYRRTFTYNPETKTVNLHGTRYVLTYNTEDNEFDQAEAAEDAVEVAIFSRPSLIHGPGFIPDGSDLKPVVRSSMKNIDGSVTLAFSSDVHYDGEHMNLATWLNATGIEYIDAMGFCGDMGSAYASNADDFWEWTGAVMDYMDSRIEDGKLGIAAYTFGNHEWFPSAGGNFKKEYERDAAKRLLRIGEAVRTDDYIIYCFGAGKSAISYDYDYDPEDVARLTEYMSTAPTDRPIFILTHYPLHYWYGRGDEREIPHAGEVIDALNAAVESGHEIIVLWGHNHSDYDDHYYQPVFPGDEIVIDASTDEDTGIMTPEEGGTRTLNFTYVAAGCTADAEYTGPDAGSAACMNKGLVVNIAEDGNITYTYYTIDGNQMGIESPWLVRFREGIMRPGSEEVALKFIDTQYVADGELAETVEAPEIEGYAFTGWYTRDGGLEVPFDFDEPITKCTLVTAKYERVIDAVGDTNNVYVTIQDLDKAAVGKTGTVIAMYPIPYEEGMTVGDAFVKVHELEYPTGTEGVEIYDTTYGFWSFKTLWGHSAENGSLAFDPTKDGCYIDANAEVTAGGSYYALGYDDMDNYRTTSFVTPGNSKTAVGAEIRLSALNFPMNSSYQYSIKPMDGDVYCGTSYDTLEKTDIVTEDGVFKIKFETEGKYIVSVRGESGGEAVAFVEALPLPSYSITFDANAEDLEGLTGSKIEGIPYEITETLERNGYTFKGWNTKSDGSGTAYNPGDIIEEDAELTLYAIWEELDFGDEDAWNDVPASGGSSGSGDNTGSSSTTEPAGDAEPVEAAEPGVEIAEQYQNVDVAITENEDGSITIDVTASGLPIELKDGVKVTVPVETKPGQVLVVVDEDGNETVLKKSVTEDGEITALLDGGATIKVVENAKEFDDVAEDDWFAEAVDFVTSHEIFQGMGDGEFGPQDTMTRAMMATVLFRLEGEPAVSGGKTFADVESGKWYTAAVNWASETGIMNGYGESFGTNDAVTREQMAVLLYNYVKSLGIETEAGSTAGFSDAGELHSWGEEAMAWAVGAGIFQGDGTGRLNPGGNATRAEVAALMMRIVQFIVK